ncbi:CRISPR-associated endonuclease Cas1 [Leptospira inadai serovar Lyme str. 10]|uniref:CRISPR-associated endonuclease Cas1 n=2 Tax=Leptospira inadai serovar Lyme TaxID=293084 RepID=V6HF65_9LEPT|nr:CRISPR-associated endonuclease Cas1 [Leptospira inadai]EQA38183.1 CRISPR-associated endonuclease Cas1 [Leptospira inadai serovar Lyme str. 10]PNV71400.1 CRISPR-associated endonuclease Cas1 [Leptospira inadai serovar Lyme]
MCEIFRTLSFKRGIPIYICDWNGRYISQLSGSHEHAVVQLRKKQLDYVDRPYCKDLAKLILYGKVKNQKAVLQYFAKYQKKKGVDVDWLEKVLISLDSITKSILAFNSENDWRSTLLGYEGSAASLYWNTLKHDIYFGDSFKGRIGRGAGDSINQALNLGYAILETYIWNAVHLAGLEPYAGVIHTDRPGKPALILDLIEEYRPWMVDRVVLTLKSHLIGTERISEEARKLVISGVQKAFESIHPYKGKKLHIEVILQRQIYRLCGVFYQRSSYRPILFKW